MFKKWVYGMLIPGIEIILVMSIVLVLTCPRPVADEGMAWRGVYYAMILWTHVTSALLFVFISNIYILFGPIRTSRTLVMRGSIPVVLAGGISLVSFIFFPETMLR